MEAPNSKNNSYELVRQEFLDNLRRGLMIWVPTQREYDKNVEIARIFRSNPSERLAFMRIRPGGFRSSRSVSKDMKLIFDSISGRAAFLYKGKTRTIQPGGRLTISPKTKYSVRTLETDEAVYLLLRVVDVTPPIKPPQVGQARVAMQTSENIVTSQQQPIHRQPTNVEKDCDFVWTPSLLIGNSGSSNRRDWIHH